MTRTRLLTVALPILISLLPLYQARTQGNRKVCLHMKSQSLHKGRVVTSEAEQYFIFPEGKILTYFHQPDEYVFITNTLGEARIYYPGQNKVYLQSNELFTSTNNSLYFFLNNQQYDLGLKDLGLKVFDSREEGQLLITSWQAPIKMMEQVDKIELVHENMLPIYSSYTNIEGKTTLKVYFEDYTLIEGSQIPKRITEIVFLPDGDSLIKRTDYSGIRSGTGCEQSKFNFTIPQDATIVK